MYPDSCKITNFVKITSFWVQKVTTIWSLLFVHKSFEREKLAHGAAKFFGHKFLSTKSNVYIVVAFCTQKLVIFTKFVLFTSLCVQKVTTI